MDDEIIEKLSELEHIQWCDWSKAISKDLNELIEILDKFGEDDLTEKEKESILNVKNRLNRWNTYWVPYCELSESDKESDRVYARKVLRILNKEL